MKAPASMVIALVFMPLISLACDRREGVYCLSKEISESGHAAFKRELHRIELAGFKREWALALEEYYRIRALLVPKIDCRPKI